MWGDGPVKTARGKKVAKRGTKKEPGGTGPKGPPGERKPGTGKRRAASGQASGSASGGARRRGPKIEEALPAPVSLDPVVRAIENLRKIRTRAEPKRAIQESIVPEVARLRHAKAALGGLDEHWDGVVPPALRERCWPVGVSRRVLTVATDNAAAMYQFSMWLRGGGEVALRTATGQRVSRVKVEMVSVDGVEPGA